eukprot:485427-Hanusia_phi.AAC.2
MVKGTACRRCLRAQVHHECMDTPITHQAGPKSSTSGPSARLSKDSDGGDIRSNLKDFGKFLSPNHKIGNRRK